jgi:hypothetical protein
MQQPLRQPDQKKINNLTTEDTENTEESILFKLINKIFLFYLGVHPGAPIALAKGLRLCGSILVRHSHKKAGH